MAENDVILLCMGAANRDPAVFDEPDVFDMTRSKIAHVGFGIGMHNCLGGNLARLQAEVVLNVLRHDYPTIELVPGDEAWQTESLILRSPSRLLARVRS